MVGSFFPAGDTDGDLNVDPTDLVRIINNAGRIDEDAMWSQGDFDVDDMVTFKDLLQTAEELGFPVANEIEHFDRLGLMTYLIEDILGTWLGDANLDGRVDFGDFATLATNFGSQQASWSAGDFDGDGTVGFSDFVLLADNYGREN